LQTQSQTNPFYRLSVTQITDKHIHLLTKNKLLKRSLSRTLEDNPAMIFYYLGLDAHPSILKSNLL